ncbi:MAG: 2-oxoacid:acceptor oxidoreductase subunit alpha [Myxococcales bacterium]|nr:2-oxoacid:acceptor oxidoreductase subunit alpha [Myxococcales bacterium]
MTTASSTTTKSGDKRELDRVTIRFAGDSGDGMQLVGSHFTTTSAVIGNDVQTLPDFPAEIRAPAGSLPGVSAFQISFAAEDIFTPGDRPDVLVAMNPAALKANLSELPRGATIIVNDDEFNKANLKKAAYEENPLDTDALDGFTVHRVPITSMTTRALEDSDLTAQQKARCKNFFALGLMYWLFDRPLDSTLDMINEKFATRATLREANVAVLKAGHAYGETTEMFHETFHVPPAELEPGLYRNITGNAATALGFLAASQQAGTPLFYGSYPITPASDVLHELARFKNFGVKTFQAEDEISAVCATVGAAWGGALALTGTSGPGLALKGEAVGMAVMVELPMVIINVQRGGPSTGLPTKTEQADLLQAIYGRNGESPLCIVAPCTPSDCFTMAIEAFRIAVKHMTPVIYLSDGYLGNGAEPWKIPDVASLPAIKVAYATQPGEGEEFLPYKRDEWLARPWAIPGTEGLEHRIGTLEKQDLTGNVSYDPANHQHMTDLRAAKIERIADDIPPLEAFGGDSGELAVVGWGGTYGALRSAVTRAQRRGAKVSHIHLRHLNPMPKNTGELLSRFDKVLVAELNCGQLRALLRAKFLIDCAGLNKVAGQPFRVSEVEAKIDELCAGEKN